jgi:hypothetical protein
MNDIQVGDTFDVYIAHYKETVTVEILYIPDRPGVPWVVRDQKEQKKWTIFTSGPFIKQFTRTS